MKKKILTITGIILILALLVLFGVKKSIQNKQNSQENRAQNFRVSERYEGIVGGKVLIFEHQNMTQYKLTQDGKVSYGELNVERGWEDDEDATVFILDWKKPESQQQYFVRLTNKPNQIQRLDSDRKLIEGAALKKEF